ncbi:hypothetical protein RUM43_011851 [Polyplax serrata]|uniref:Uncharacterized protein n=1 Tax=Polyplax serrata TaxID=468196 RepID=A0AAN8Q3F1_POLSC
MATQKAARQNEKIWHIHNIQKYIVLTRGKFGRSFTSEIAKFGWQGNWVGGREKEKERERKREGSLARIVVRRRSKIHRRTFERDDKVRNNERQKYRIKIQEFTTAKYTASIA